ncbi:hypothetical protein ES703_84222 [subsurface metagenome]
MKAFLISIMATITITFLYFVITYEFKIPFFYTALIGLIMFILIYFNIRDLKI